MPFAIGVATFNIVEVKHHDMQTKDGEVWNKVLALAEKCRLQHHTNANVHQNHYNDIDAIQTDVSEDEVQQLTRVGCRAWVPLRAQTIQHPESENEWERATALQHMNEYFVDTTILPTTSDTGGLMGVGVNLGAPGEYSFASTSPSESIIVERALSPRVEVVALTASDLVSFISHGPSSLHPIDEDDFQYYPTEDRPPSTDASWMVRLSCDFMSLSDGQVVTSVEESEAVIRTVPSQKETEAQLDDMLKDSLMGIVECSPDDPPNKTTMGIEQ